MNTFLSTPSVGRATPAAAGPSCRCCISIHALRGEGDSRKRSPAGGHRHFYPRPPWGGRPRAPETGRGALMYFYPRPPWGGRRCSSWPTVYSSLISIHALRGEGDTTHIQPPSLQSHFYPRPPWGGRRILTLRLPAHKRFLSTPSVGRATCSTATIQSAWPFLSTPSVGRATKIPAGCWRTRRISIHALRGEGDADTCRPGRESPDFYPRPPWGGRPRRSTTLSASTSISIHALRGEGDQLPFPSQCQRSRISIHALRGEGDRLQGFPPSAG